MSCIRKCGTKATTKTVAAKKTVKTEASKAAPAPKKAAAPKAAPLMAATKKAAPAPKKVVAPKAAPKAAIKKTAPAPKKVAKRKVAFDKFAPDSQTVAIAGEFNGWDATAFLLKRDAEGNWHGSVQLAPGTYQYRFVFDGSSWEHDPDREAVADANGLLNNLLIVT